MTAFKAPAVAMVIVLATITQLAVATAVPGIERFDGKAFGARLVAYPALMLLLPALWALVRYVRGGKAPLPWAGFAWIMLPFAVDVTGNSLDLYDQVVWWDDANHLVNWFLLSLGCGLLLRRGIGSAASGWREALLVTGLGAVLAIGWELAEWYMFIRHGTELTTAYTDTLGDEALGTVGAALAGLILATRRFFPQVLASRGRPALTP